MKPISSVDDDWCRDPYPIPPFFVLDRGETATIIDREGHEFVHDFRAKGFVRKLADIMNAHADALVSAWRKG